MNNTSNKGKEIKIPGPDHPITISPAGGKVRVTVAGRIVAESRQALRWMEKGYPPVYYLPRSDADMSLLVRTTHYTYCPYKGDCTYEAFPLAKRNRNMPFGHAKSHMKRRPKLKSSWRFPSRVDAIETIS
jgi:uncharacterized protein (DUF427 family)